jgi:hypothetical protein
MIVMIPIDNRRNVASLSFDGWLPEGRQVSLCQVAWLSDAFQSID